MATAARSPLGRLRVRDLGLPQQARTLGTGERDPLRRTGGDGTHDRTNDLTRWCSYQPKRIRPCPDSFGARLFIGGTTIQQLRCWMLWDGARPPSRIVAPPGQNYF